MRKRIIILLTFVAVLAVVFGIFRARRANGNSTYRFAQVERGDVTQVVSTTGTLQAIKSVQVGTQVSGQISQLSVDFNDHVHKGQLLARIDPTLLQQQVRSAEANLDRATAALEQNRQEFQRDTVLYARKVLSESDYETARYNYAVARAELQSARISLAQARRNLAYTEITSPIDGVVIERDVDVGQTVAANFSAPQLFLLAEDLSKLEIIAAVDESDIGQIKQDQNVSFTVQSYPDRTFAGRVRQVRLQSTTTSNVVTYNVVVSVENPGGLLLPGMTATVDFEVAKATDVFKVSSAALRLQPTTAMLAKLPRHGRPDSLRAGGGPGAGMDRSAGRAGRSGRAGRDSAFAHRGAMRDSTSRGRLWYLDDQGHLAVLPVHTGISDGKVTEISGPPQLAAGLKVIVAVTSGKAAKSDNSNSSNSPFQNQQQRRSFGGPPPGM
jgi:HlyD family secretion protein